MRTLPDLYRPLKVIAVPTPDYVELGVLWLDTKGTRSLLFDVHLCQSGEVPCIVSAGWKVTLPLTVSRHAGGLSRRNRHRRIVTKDRRDNGDEGEPMSGQRIHRVIGIGTGSAVVEERGSLS